MVLCYAPEFFSEAELRKSAGSHGPGICDAQIIIGYSKPLDRPKPIFWSWRKLLFKNKIGKQGVSKQKPSDTYIRLWYQYQLTGKKIIVSRDRADIIWIKKKTVKRTIYLGQQAIVGWVTNREFDLVLVSLWVMSLWCDIKPQRHRFTGSHDARAKSWNLAII